MSTYVVAYGQDIDQDALDAEVAEVLWLINERILGGADKQLMAVALSMALKEYLDNSEAFGIHH